MSRNSLQFQRRGRSVRIGEFSPRTTLLDWLRLQERSIGTKEGCAEGDCGACAVVVVRERDGRLVYEPVNSCITLLGQLDGAELITVEDLADEGVLHPVQEAMARDHGSQCGFCTPGIVMSLFAHYHECNGATTRDKINDALAGNLCRCTGYRPIVDAALEVCNGADDQFTRNAAARLAGDRARSTTRPICSSAMRRAFFAAPASEQSLAQLYAQHPDATIVAGATDVGLWITKKLTPIEKIIHVGRVAELSAIEETADGLRARRDRFAGARRAGAGIDRSRHRRGAAPVRLDSGARLRHGRRQHRQRLADRRSRADADCAGRQRWSCASGDKVRQLAAGELLPRLRQAGPRARANSCAGCWCRSCRSRRIFAPTRSPSVSTRIFPRCWRRFA